MNQTPPELLAPYKSALVAAARDLLRAAGSDGIAIEIPASVPPSVVVLGAEDQVGKLLRTSLPELPGGRRAGDPPPAQLQWEEATPGAPRKWTILLTSEGHGLVGALGSKHEHADARHERVDVVEMEPVLQELLTVVHENEQHQVAVKELRAQLAEMQRQVDVVRHAGGLMANTMFNLGQKPGAVVDQRLAGSMREMQRDWDAALRAAPEP